VSFGRSAAYSGGLCALHGSLLQSLTQLLYDFNITFKDKENALHCILSVIKKTAQNLISLLS